MPGSSGRVPNETISYPAHSTVEYYSFLFVDTVVVSSNGGVVCTMASRQPVHHLVKIIVGKNKIKPLIALKSSVYLSVSSMNLTGQWRETGPVDCKWEHGANHVSEPTRLTARDEATHIGTRKKVRSSQLIKASKPSTQHRQPGRMSWIWRVVFSPLWTTIVLEGGTWSLTATIIYHRKRNNSQKYFADTWEVKAIFEGRRPLLDNSECRREVPEVYHQGSLAALLESTSYVTLYD